jgi:hypothetical protein
MIECALVGTVSGLAVFALCHFIASRRKEARKTQEALRVWAGQPRDEHPVCLYDPGDLIGGTRIRVAARPATMQGRTKDL